MRAPGDDREASCSDQRLVHRLTDHRADRRDWRAVAGALPHQLWNLGCYSRLCRTCGRQPCTELGQIDPCTAG
jgi:hypothetical protein